MFIIKGIFQGRTVTIKYSVVDEKDPRTDYILTGDQSVIEKAKYENIQNHGRLGLEPDTVTEDYLNFELSAHQLLSNFVFDSIISEENDWEPFDPDVTY